MWITHKPVSPQTYPQLWSKYTGVISWLPTCFHLFSGVIHIIYTQPVDNCGLRWVRRRPTQAQLLCYARVPRLPKRATPAPEHGTCVARDTQRRRRPQASPRAPRQHTSATTGHHRTRGVRRPRPRGARGRRAARRSRAPTTPGRWREGPSASRWPRQWLAGR